MFTLTIENANGQAEDRFSFDHGAYVIGRHESCDIVLPSASVSRQHARIFVDNGRCFVEDMGSSNGVVVDGQRVVNQRDLGMASQIKIGDFYLYLEYKRGDASRQNVLQTLYIEDDAGHAKLVRINDSFAGEEFTLSEVENSIGRTDENFILLSDASISRQHSKIVRMGDKYSVVDLGSSNGTRVNGKKTTNLIDLKFGDRVHFGNVEFVFVPGDAKINPADYAGRPGSSNFVLMAGVGVVVLLGLAAGALIVFSLLSFKESKNQAEAEPATKTVESEAATRIKTGNRLMESRDWKGAIAAFDEALTISPGHPEATKSREVAEREYKAVQTLEKGERLVEEGRHNEAKETLESIPEDTDAATRAKPTLQHIRSRLAYTLRNDAMRMMKSKKKHDLVEAHVKLREALALKPDDDKALELIKELEPKLKKKKLPYEPYVAK